MEDRDTRLKRLQYRSTYTGTKETDAFLGAFAARHLAELPPDLLDQYEALLENDDPDLFQWISGQKPVPAVWDNAIMDMIKNFRIGQ